MTTDLDTLTRAVSETVALMAKRPPGSLDEIVAVGKRLGLTQVEINFLWLVPSAFASRYYQGDADIHIENTFLILFPDEPPLQRAFADIMIYRIAAQMAAKTERAKCLPLVEQSAEYAIIMRDGREKVAKSRIKVAIGSQFNVPAEAYRA
jgi:hypothetical protein